jgi:hypothetical protein
MQDTFKSATTRVVILSLALLLVLFAPVKGAARQLRGAEDKTAFKPTTALVAAVPDQSGYWAQVVARDATVRVRPGGSVIGRLTNGQWFHVYPSYSGNSAWLLGYMCPRGNRGCGNRESLPGFIMRSVLTGPRAALPAGELFTATYRADTSERSDDAFAFEDARFIPASFYPSASLLYGVALAQGSERRICSEQVWMRNDRLWPIELLYKNERFYVERYTDGSKEDGKRRWAIGRARGIRGRVMVSSLCS